MSALYSSVAGRDDIERQEAHSSLRTDQSTPPSIYGSHDQNVRLGIDDDSQTDGRTSTAVDVVVYKFTSGGEHVEGEHITSLEQLERLLSRDPQVLSLTTESYEHILLLVNDISDDVYQTLSQHLALQNSKLARYREGRVNREHTRSHSMHNGSEKLESTIFDRLRPDQKHDSITWWKLFSHSRDGYILEKEAFDIARADTKRVVVPHFVLNVSDTLQVHQSSELERIISRRTKQLGSLANRSVDWAWGSAEKAGLRKRRTTSTLEQSELTHSLQMSPVSPKTSKVPAVETEPDDEEAESGGISVRNVHKLANCVYRPHQIVTEVFGGRWGCAAEERIVFSQTRRESIVFHVLLFDTSRQLKTIKQTMAARDQLNDALSHAKTFVEDVVFSANPLKHVKAEVAGAEVPTFLGPIASDATVNMTSGRDSVEQAGLMFGARESYSTRDYFAIQAHKQGLFRPWSNSGSGASKIVANIKLAFATLVAEDWNLILSQMGATLDDIDGKMADNVQLRENVLSWRRLLGSWRVSLGEYSIRLQEANNVLLHEFRESRLGPMQDTEAAIDAYEEWDHMLRLFDVLQSALEKIEGRVNLSFQALMSSMSIVESEKAITQGLAITRLTELAFVFIPLSFAASVFSMDVKDYDTHRPTLGWFFLTGALLLICLYLLRGVIRSKALANARHRLAKRIRTTSKVPGTEDIPTRVVFSYFWQQLTPLTQALVVVIPTVILGTTLTIALAPHHSFRGGGSFLLIFGGFWVLFFTLERVYARAMWTGIIFLWAYFVAAICASSLHPPRLAARAGLVIMVTSFAVFGLAYTAPRDINYPFRRAWQVTMPIWVILLPSLILKDYHDVSTNPWPEWALPICIQPFVIIFAIVPARWPRPLKDFWHFLAVVSLTVGIPLPLIWMAWPDRAKHPPAVW